MEDIKIHSWTSKGCTLCLDVDYVEKADHKAVVETMQNKIEELTKINNDLKCCGTCYYEDGARPCDNYLTCFRSDEVGHNVSNDLWIAKGIK